jgi:hypothetical protein
MNESLSAGFRGQNRRRAAGDDTRLPREKAPAVEFAAPNSSIMQPLADERSEHEYRVCVLSPHVRSLPQDRVKQRTMAPLHRCASYFVRASVFSPCRRKKKASASITKLPGAWPVKVGMSTPSMPAMPVISMAPAMM